MSSSNYIKLFLVFAIVMLAGCGRKSAPDFDNDRAEALLDACEAMVEHREDDAVKAISRLNEMPGADDFASSAELAMNRRLEFDNAEKLLEQSDFLGLKEYLAVCRARGTAGAELEGFADLPDALIALSLFKSRMPWEKSSDLKNGLEDLESHRKLLMKSTEFQTFYKAQLDELGRLQAVEAAARADVFLQKMDMALAAGNLQVFHETVNEFRQDQPQHVFFEFQKLISAEHMPENIKKQDETAFAVASIAEWNTLKDELRNKVSEYISARSSAGICSKLILALHDRTAQAYENFFEAAASCGISEKYAADYVNILGLSATGRLSPCPGMAELSGLQMK